VVICGLDINPKTIKLVFDASPLMIIANIGAQYYFISSKEDWDLIGNT
jgi:hypothetical protein